MVISGLSILAVEDGYKKIYDTGVFAITAISSLWAYIWLLIVLTVWTPDNVTMIEAILTLAYFAILLIMAFLADRYKANKMKSHQTKEDKEKELNHQKKLIAKDDLIKLVDNKTYSKEFLLNLAFGSKNAESEDEYKKLADLFRAALQVETLDGLDIAKLASVFEPDNDLQ